jgi:Tat protein secretion system quality control protein TatD with DNase activity
MTRSVSFSVGLLALLLATSAVAERYDDLAKWAERDKASSRQLLLDMARAKSAHDFALALRASADRQHKITSELIDIVHHHPELRCMAELGLDEDAFQRWSEQHPDADERRAQLPREVIDIAKGMQKHSESLSRAPDVAARQANTAKYRHDPEVVAAAEQLGSILQDNQRRLLKAFE